MHTPGARLQRVVIQVQVLQRDAAVGVRPAGRQRAVEVVLGHIVVQHVGRQRRRQRALQFIGYELGFHGAGFLMHCTYLRHVV